MTDTVILTGPVNSGKSSFLHSWFSELPVSGKSLVCGFLTVPVPARKTKRYSCLLLPDLQEISMQPSEDIDCVPVGPYRLSARAFSRANQHVAGCIDSHDLVIIDEAGMLELRQKGFYSGLDAALNSGKPVIVTVRDFLLQKFLACFQPRFSHRCFTVIKSSSSTVGAELSKLVL